MPREFIEVQTDTTEANKEKFNTSDWVIISLVLFFAGIGVINSVIYIIDLISMCK